MRNPPPPSLTQDALHALVDERLDAVQRAELERRLALDPQAQATVAQWRAQRDLLQGLHKDVAQETPPSHLLSAVAGPDTTLQASNSAWRWSGVAASVVLSFAVGWLAHGHIGAADNYAQQSPRPVATEFVRQAGLAYAVYTPEVKHPVEVTTAEQAHLLQWLSKRLGRPLKVPDLSAQGYELVGGRLLPGDAGARAQFMFQTITGNRVTLYLGLIQAGSSGDLNPQETSFQFSQQGASNSFYWVDQGFGYAITGTIPRDTLMQLARASYQQLN